MFEIIDFLKGLVGMVDTISVVAVFVLVWLWGKLGLTGKWQLVSSFLTGVVVGVLQQFSTGLIVGFAGWFQTIIYGIILGGLASGAYETIKSALAKSMVDTLELSSEEQELLKTAPPKTTMRED